MPKRRKPEQVGFGKCFEKERGPRILDWKDRKHASSADCKVIVQCEALSKEYRLHLRVLCKSSGFFFKVANRDVQAIQFGFTARGKMIACKEGNIQVKLQDGSTVFLGKSTDSLRALKRRVRDTYDIPIENQRYFRVEGNNHYEVRNEWERLSENEATLLLIPREPWQRVDLETKTVYLSLPKSCLDSFERILDFMYSYRCDESCFQKLGELSPSSVLPALWLAGHLDIPDLEDHLPHQLP